MLVNNEAQTIPARVGFRRAGLRETTVLLVVAWLIPFAVHLLPWSGEVPLGAHLLPMFWAAFASVYLFGLRTGLLVGLFAPTINLLITGFPAMRWQGVMAFELIVFALFAWWMVRRVPRLWLLAPLGYVVAKVSSTLLQLVVAPFGEIGSPATFLIHSLRNGLPGLAVLTAVNLGLVLLYPKTSEVNGDDSSEI